MDSAVRFKIISKRSLKRRLERTIQRNITGQDQNLNDELLSFNLNPQTSVPEQINTCVQLNDNQFEDYVWSESEDEIENEHQNDCQELSWCDEIQNLAIKHNLTQSVVSDFLKLLVKKGVTEVFSVFYVISLNSFLLSIKN